MMRGSGLGEIEQGHELTDADINSFDERQDLRRGDAGKEIVEVAGIYGVFRPGFSTGHTKPKVALGWKDAESAVGLPNHSERTGARTFLPVSPPLSILSTSTPR